MSGAGDLAMLGRVMGGLIVVLVVIGLVAKIARRARGQNGNSGLRVVDRLGLSREANLAVIEVSNRMLLLGVTAQGVTMLADLDDEARSARDLRPLEPTQVDLTEYETSFPADQFDADSGFDDAEFDVDSEFDPNSEVDDDDPEFDDEPFVKNDLQVDVEPPPAPDFDAEFELAYQRPRAGHTLPFGTSQPTLPPHGTANPTGLALDEYPDLASALRAAGRTAEPSRPTSPIGTASAHSANLPAPRTRAEARAQRMRAEAEAEAEAQLQTQVQAQAAALIAAANAYPAAAYAARPPRPPVAHPAPRPPAPAAPAAPQPQAKTTPPHRTPKAGALRVTRIDEAGNRLQVVDPGSGRGQQAQASGSVLSPRTWRQGVEALRELTVRRG